MNCRYCYQPVSLKFLDLGSSPPSNSYLTAQTLGRAEQWFPLVVWVCEACWLVQCCEQQDSLSLFQSDYAYFSGFSSTWLNHCQSYVDTVSQRFSLNQDSLVVEVAANDGYLLQYFKSRGIPHLGIEPTAACARAAEAKGIEILQEFFGTKLALGLARQGTMADLMVANNVLAHVPDVNDFVFGFTSMLKPQGVVTFEFPHLMSLVERKQFDTIYHEHYCYLSFTTASAILTRNALQVFEVEKLPTHGGSLRVYAQRADYGEREVQPSVSNLLQEEKECGLCSAAYYRGFQAAVEKIKDDLLTFLLAQKRAGKTVAAYGAAAKGSTFLNFAGIRGDLVAAVADLNPSKQGKYMPGSRIPIVNEEQFRAGRPDFVLILPWNLRSEIRQQLDYVREWGGLFVTAIPQLEVF